MHLIYLTHAPHLPHSCTSSTSLMHLIYLTHAPHLPHSPTSLMHLIYLANILHSCTSSTSLNHVHHLQNHSSLVAVCSKCCKPAIPSSQSLLDVIYGQIGFTLVYFFYLPFAQCSWLYSIIFHSNPTWSAFGLETHVAVRQSTRIGRSFIHRV